MPGYFLKKSEPRAEISQAGQPPISTLFKDTP